MQPKNLKDLISRFSSEEICREYLVKQRWNSEPVCPKCGSNKSYIIEGGKRFKCGNKECYKKYSVTVGTIFENSPIPLTTWFAALYLISAHKKGISSLQLSKDLGVTQKTAWFMLHRIRESLKDKNPRMLEGTVEVDETYMGKKFRSEFQGLSDWEIQKTTSKDKGLVLGMIERETKTARILVLPQRLAEPIKNEIKKAVVEGSNIYTDQTNLYKRGLYMYNHKSCFHTGHQWVRGKVHTNTIESFWSTMKRGLYGIYHNVSYKHLQRYCDEFSFRYNLKSIPDNMRFAVTLTQLQGRLTYNQLTNGEEKKG